MHNTRHSGRARRIASLLMAATLVALTPTAARANTVTTAAELIQAIEGAGANEELMLTLPGGTMAFEAGDRALVIGGQRNITLTGGSGSVLARGELDGPVATVESNGRLTLESMTLDASGDVAIENRGMLYLEPGATVRGTIHHEGQTLRLRADVSVDRIHLPDGKALAIFRPLSGDARVGVAVESPRDALVVATGASMGDLDHLIYLGEGYELAFDAGAILLAQTDPGPGGPGEPGNPATLDALREALLAGDTAVIDNAGGPIAVAGEPLAISARGVTLRSDRPEEPALTRAPGYGGPLVSVAGDGGLALDHITLTGRGMLVDLRGKLSPGAGAVIGTEPGDGGVHVDGGIIDLGGLSSAGARIQVASVTGADDGVTLAVGATDANAETLHYLPDDGLAIRREGDALVLRRAGGEPDPGPGPVDSLGALKAALQGDGDSIVIDNRSGPIPVTETLYLPGDRQMALSSLDPESPALTRGTGFGGALMDVAAGAHLALGDIALPDGGTTVALWGRLTAHSPVWVGGASGGVALMPGGILAAADSGVLGSSKVYILSAEGREPGDAIVENLDRSSANAFVYLPGDYGTEHDEESRQLRLIERPGGPVRTLAGLHNAFNVGVDRVVIAELGQAIAVQGEPVILPPGRTTTLTAENATAAALTRGTGFEGPLLQVRQGAELTLEDITLSGGGTLLEVSGDLALRGRVVTEQGGIHLLGAVIVLDDGALSAGSYIAIAEVDNPHPGLAVARKVSAEDAARFAYTGEGDFALRLQGDTLLLERTHTAFDLDELRAHIAGTPAGGSRRVTLGAPLSIAGEVTLSGSGKTIDLVRRPGLDGPLFTVAEGGSLTLSGLALDDTEDCIEIGDGGTLHLRDSGVKGSVTNNGRLVLEGAVFIGALDLSAPGPAHLDLTGLTGGEVLIVGFGGAGGGHRLADAVTDAGLKALRCALDQHQQPLFYLHRSPATGALLLADGMLEDAEPFDPAEPANLRFGLSPYPKGATGALLAVGDRTLPASAAALDPADGTLLLRWDALGEPDPGLYDIAATMAMPGGQAVYLGTLAVTEPDDGGGGPGGGNETGGGGNTGGGGSGSRGGGGGGGWTNTLRTAVTASPVAPTPVPLAESTALAAFETAHAETAAGLPLTLTFKGASDVPADVLAALRARAAATGRQVTLQFDSLSATGAVDIRLYLPLSSAGGFTASGSISGAGVAGVQTHFERYYANRLAVVHLSQGGDFESPVRLAARVDLGGWNTETVAVYRYDLATNRYLRLSDPAADYRGGYLYFTAPGGGHYIVSEGDFRARS